jgi:hypothetical protein
MRKHLQGIDHVVHCVHDLDAAAAFYARLGFTITPRGVHSVGTENRCVMLGHDYIELLAVPRMHPTTQFYADFLAVGEGLAAVALRTDSARGAYRELTGAGFAASAPSDLSRPVEIDGLARRAEFSLTFLADGELPGVRAFCCEHRTRELVWLPEYRAHLNGARSLAALALVADDPRDAAAPFERLFGTAAVSIDEGLLVATGDAPIAVSTPRALARRLPNVWITGRPGPAMAVLFVHVADREAVAALLARNGVDALRMPDGSVAVGAMAAHGVAVVFG